MLLTTKFSNALGSWGVQHISDFIVAPWELVTHDHLLVQRNLYVANEHPPYCKSVIAIRKLRLLLQIILNNRVKQEQIFVFC